MEGVYQTDFIYLNGSFSEFGGKTNEYTGSLPAKNGTKGTFADCFRYRLSLVEGDGVNEKGKEIKIIVEVKAQCWFGPFALEATDPGIIKEASFSPDEDGVKEALKWLQIVYDNA